MRLFLAIELSEGVRKQLAELSRHFQENWGERLLGPSPRPYPRCSWVRPQNLHITLKFLGEVEDARLPEVTTALGKVAALGPLKVQPDRIEALPPRGPVRVIAIGLGGQTAELEDLYRTIEAQCNPIGFPPEGRKYRPHITLARARSPLHGSVRPALANAAADWLPTDSMMINEFVLMESHLNRDAALYVPLARFPLSRG